MKLKLDAEEIAEIENVESMYYEKVKPIGNGSMVSVPKKYLGRDVIVIVKKLDPRKKF